MTITYVGNGAWGTGTGIPLSVAEGDGNFYDLDQRIEALNDDLTVGKRISSVSSTTNSMTFTFTDGSTQVIPLAVAEIRFVGAWTNSAPQLRGNLFLAPGIGIYQTLVDHITPAFPATFDPDAVSDDTDADPLYTFVLPLYAVNEDIYAFVRGSIQGAEGDLLHQDIMNRTLRLVSGNDHAYAYLEIGNDGSDATDIILSIQQNGVEVGTITFAAFDADTDGHQEGVVAIPVTTEWAERDVLSIRITQSDNPDPANLSVTLPFLRTDI